MSETGTKTKYDPKIIRPLSNGQKKWQTISGKGWGLVIPVAGGEDIYLQACYSEIFATSSCEMMIATINEYSVAESGIGYPGNDNSEELCVCTNLYLLDSKGKRYHLGRAGNCPKAPRYNPLENGGASFSFCYELLGGHRDPNQEIHMTYNIYPQKGEDYVDVEVIKRVQENEEKSAFRFWSDGKKEKIQPRAIRKVRSLKK